MKAGDPVGGPVEAQRLPVAQTKRPLAVGIWVWHAQTKEGPWVVLWRLLP